MFVKDVDFNVQRHEDKTIIPAPNEPFKNLHRWWTVLFWWSPLPPFTDSFLSHFLYTVHTGECKRSPRDSHHKIELNDNWTKILSHIFVLWVSFMNTIRKVEPFSEWVFGSEIEVAYEIISPPLRNGALEMKSILPLRNRERMFLIVIKYFICIDKDAHKEYKEFLGAIQAAACCTSLWANITDRICETIWTILFAERTH